jgi:hypothetical protein
MNFGHLPFGASDQSIGAQLAERRIDPMSGFKPPKLDKEKAPKGVPSTRQLHGHLNAAKAASTDDEKRMHVFKALSALKRRMSSPASAAGASAGGEAGSSSPGALQDDMGAI